VATSVPSERLYSTAGTVVTAKRRALEPENVEKLGFFACYLINDLSYSQIIRYELC